MGGWVGGWCGGRGAEGGGDTVGGRFAAGAAADATPGLGSGSGGGHLPGGRLGGGSVVVVTVVVARCCPAGNEALRRLCRRTTAASLACWPKDRNKAAASVSPSLASPAGLAATQWARRSCLLSSLRAAVRCATSVPAYLLACCSWRLPNSCLRCRGSCRWRGPCRCCFVPPAVNALHRLC